MRYLPANKGWVVEVMGDKTLVYTSVNQDDECVLCVLCVLVSCDVMIYYRLPHTHSGAIQSAKPCACVVGARMYDKCYAAYVCLNV